MRIEIEIPKEFEEHFNTDQFEESMNRITADVHLLAGRYEREMLKMLIKAFKESKPAYDSEKVVEKLENAKNEIFLSDDDLEYYQNGISDAIEIVKKGD